MSVKFLRSLAAGAALLLGQSALGATFDFGTPFTPDAAGYSMTVDGITVTVTTQGSDSLAYYSFNYNGYGLGHSGCVFIVCSNGLQQNETLVVSFSEAVTVDNITLAAWDGPDTALLATPGGATMTLDDDPLGQINSFSLTGLGELTSFTITNTKFAGLFTLNGLSVSPVPVPAAAWLFISAIGGLVGARRMRRG